MPRFNYQEGGCTVGVHSNHLSHFKSDCPNEYAEYSDDKPYDNECPHQTQPQQFQTSNVYILFSQQKNNKITVDKENPNRVSQKLCR